MTLSGKGDPDRRRDDAKEFRRDVDERRPWLFWLLVGVGVVGVAVVLIVSLASGNLF